MTGPVFTAHYFTKSTPDLSKTVVLVQEYAQITMDVYYSTFLIDNVTHKITKVIDKAQLPDLQTITNSLDFDMEGNMYYIRLEAGATNKTGIVRVNASGSTDLRTDFLKSGTAEEIAVSKSGKIFLAITHKITVNGKDGVGFSLCVLE